MRNVNVILVSSLLFSFLLNCGQSNEADHLSSMAKTLNENIPEFKNEFDDQGFYVSNGIPKNFFVFDLIDTAKNIYPPNKKIELGLNGVYHFAPLRKEFSFSFIAVINNGSLTIFKKINCPQYGDNIAEVLIFVKSNFKTDEVLERRLMNYRSYGIYFRADPQSSFQCY